MIRNRRYGKLEEGSELKVPDPAMLAAADQMTAEFKEVTTALREIQHRARLEAGRREPDPGESKRISRDLFDIMDVAFIQDPRTEKVFNYVMFLIDLVDTYESDRDRILDHLNGAGLAINQAARALGAQPMVGVADGQNQHRPQT